MGIKLATEKKDFYKLEVMVETTNVLLNNLEIKFNRMSLYSEYEDTEVNILDDRKVVFEPERTIDGFRVKVFILNDSDNEEERIDYLIDEEYEIQELDLSIKNTNGVVYEYSINMEVGEQVNQKEVEVELNPEMKNAISFISNYIENDVTEMCNKCFEILDKDDIAVKSINTISQIEII